jgi:hypothetical protein
MMRPPIMLLVLGTVGNPLLEQEGALRYQFGSV